MHTDLNNALKPSPAKPSRGGLMRALLFIHLLVSPLIFSTRTLDSFEYPKVIALTVTALLLLGGATASWVQRFLQKKEGGHGVGRTEPFFREWTSLGVLLFFFSAFCSTLFSMNRPTSFYGEHEVFAGLITMASYTILFFGTRSLCRDENTCKTLLVAVVFGVVGVVIYGVAQVTGLDPFTWKSTALFSTVTRIFGTMGHPNHLAAYLTMGFPIVCVFRMGAFKKRSFLTGFALLITELFAAALVVLSLSRGGWVAMVVMLLAFGIGLTSVGERKKILLGALFPWIIGLILGVFTLSIISSIDSGEAGPLKQPVPFIQKTDEEPVHLVWSRIKQMGISDLTEGTRWPIWTAAFNMFLDHPLFGVGLDCFHLAYMQYRTTDQWVAEWGSTPAKAHNEALHILATQGGVGFVAFLIMTTGLLSTFVRATRRYVPVSMELPTDKAAGLVNSWCSFLPDRHLPIALFAGTLGFYMQNLTNFTVVACGTLFMTFAALLTNLGESLSVQAVEQTPPERSFLPVFSRISFFQKGIHFIIWVLTGIAIYSYAYLPYRANILFRSGHKALSRNPVHATLVLKEAIAIDPTKNDYYRYLGVAYRKAASNTSDISLRKKFFTWGRAAHERAIDLVPTDVYNWLAFAEFLDAMAQESPPLATKEEVYHAIGQAFKLDPNNGDIYPIATDIAIAFGDRANAVQWASEGASLYPNFALPHAQLGTIALLDSIMFLNSNLPDKAKKRARDAMDYMERSLLMFWNDNKISRQVAQRDLAKGHLLYAKAEEQLGAFDQAYASYTRLLEAQPSHPEGTKAFEAFRERMTGRKDSPFLKK